MQLSVCGLSRLLAAQLTKEHVFAVRADEGPRLPNELLEELCALYVKSSRVPCY